MANPVFAAVTKFEKIQSYVLDGTLSYPSYILCREDWTWAFVDKDGSIQRVKGYQQESIIPVDVLPTENIRTDAFYFCNGVGYLYINGSFVPVFNDVDNQISSYNQLSDIPIVNMHGDMAAPLDLSGLENGSYSISGQYTIGSLGTTFVTSSKAIFLVDSDEENKYITKLDPKKIITYTINFSTLEVVTSNYATEAWVQAQNYVTEAFVNQAIEDLYQRIASQVLITKVSQLENDAGYLTAENLEEISGEDIANLF